MYSSSVSDERNTITRAFRTKKWDKTSKNRVPYVPYLRQRRSTPRTTTAPFHYGTAQAIAPKATQSLNL